MNNPSSSSPSVKTSTAGRRSTILLPSRSMQHVWYEATSGLEWQVLHIVALDDRHTALGIAYEIANMAALEPQEKVAFVNASRAPLGIIGKDNENRIQIIDFTSSSQGQDAVAAAEVGLIEIPKLIDGVKSGSADISKMIIASGSPLFQPESVAISRKSDAIAICLTLGVATFQETERTAMLLGDEKIIGVITSKPRRSK
jgi:hypothetical protein